MVIWASFYVSNTLITFHSMVGILRREPAAFDQA